jgi:hypothetical protein
MAVRRRAFGRALRGEIRPEAVGALRESTQDRARMGSSGYVQSDDEYDEKD